MIPAIYKLCTKKKKAIDNFKSFNRLSLAGVILGDGYCLSLYVFKVHTLKGTQLNHTNLTMTIPTHITLLLHHRTSPSF